MGGLQRSWAGRSWGAPAERAATRLVARKAGTLARTWVQHGHVRRRVAQAVGAPRPAPRSPTPVERLQHLCGRQVELVQHDPVAVPHRLHQRALAEHQPPGLVAHVRPQVLLRGWGVGGCRCRAALGQACGTRLGCKDSQSVQSTKARVRRAGPPCTHLQVCLLVVVDAHKGVTRLGSQVGHQARLAAAGGALHPGTSGAWETTVGAWLKRTASGRPPRPAWQQHAWSYAGLALCWQACWEAPCPRRCAPAAGWGSAAAAQLGPGCAGGPAPWVSAQTRRPSHLQEVQGRGGGGNWWWGAHPASNWQHWWHAKAPACKPPAARLVLLPPAQQPTLAGAWQGAAPSANPELVEQHVVRAGRRRRGAQQHLQRGRVGG